MAILLTVSSLFCIFMCLCWCTISQYLYFCYLYATLVWRWYRIISKYNNFTSLFPCICCLSYRHDAITGGLSFILSECIPSVGLNFEIQLQNDRRYVALIYPETLWKERERSNNISCPKRVSNVNERQKFKFANIWKIETYGYIYANCPIHEPILFKVGWESVIYVYLRAS